jgi:hypothetical protein
MLSNWERCKYRNKPYHLRGESLGWPVVHRQWWRRADTPGLGLRVSTTRSCPHYRLYWNHSTRRTRQYRRAMYYKLERTFVLINIVRWHYLGEL